METKSAGNCGFGHISGEIPNGKLHFLCSANHAFCVSNLRIFNFALTFQQDKPKGAYFKYDNMFFQIPVQKYQNKAFLVKNTQLRHFWSQI